MRRWLMILFLSALFGSIIPVNAQSLAQVCGDVIKGEFTENDQGIRYTFDLEAGTQLKAQGHTFGDMPEFAIALFDPGGNDIVGAGVWRTTNAPAIDSGLLSANGEYTLIVANTIIDYVDNWGRMYNGGLGVYFVDISCVLPDGTSIQAGQSEPEVEPTPTLDNGPIFPGIGFPGLPPVDFSSVIPTAVVPGFPFSGQVTAGGAMSSYTFDAAEGNTVSLSFTRAAGNLNLGLVVLFGDNQVVYQSSLINTQTMNAVFAAPFSGTYTLSLYQIDLLPPAAPEPTAFQLQVDVQ